MVWIMQQCYSVKKNCSLCFSFEMHDKWELYTYTLVLWVDAVYEADRWDLSLSQWISLRLVPLYLLLDKPLPTCFLRFWLHLRDYHHHYHCFVSSDFMFQSCLGATHYYGWQATHYLDHKLWWYQFQQHFAWSLLRFQKYTNWYNLKYTSILWRLCPHMRHTIHTCSLQIGADDISYSNQHHSRGESVYPVLSSLLASMLRTLLCGTDQETVPLCCRCIDSVFVL